jgi:glucuronoarabinoxylan endo-1,4-beta-xylanase
MRASASAFLLVSLYALEGRAQTVTVDARVVHQTIDGFGASNAYESAPLTSAQAEFWFGTGPADIGLSLLRTELPDDGSCGTVGSACAGTYVSDMKLAAAMGVKIWSTPWSPPASMKSNGSTICNTGSGAGSLSVGSYAAYATYLTNYVKSLKARGIDLYALSIQNEPDYCPTTYDGALWSGPQFDTFVGTNLGPAFASAGLTGKTLIMMPESSQWGSFSSQSAPTMGDSKAAGYIGINAWHDYDDAASITNPYVSQGKKFWETEASAGSGFGPSLCGGCWDPSMADGLLWAAIVDDRLAVANANAWHYWWLVDPGSDDNEALTGADGVTIPKRTYVLGQYSRFVRPGFRRVDATHTPQPGVLATAFADPAGPLVIVAINQNASSTSQTFALVGAPAMSMTPWITDATSNLAVQAVVGVSAGAFTYLLPAQSVTTLVLNPPPGGDDAPPMDGGSRDAGNKPGMGQKDAAPDRDGERSDAHETSPGGQSSRSGGCACRASPVNEGPVGAAFTAATVVAAARRRRRKRKPIPSGLGARPSRQTLARSLFVRFTRCRRLELAFIRYGQRP